MNQLGSWELWKRQRKLKDEDALHNLNRISMKVIGKVLYTQLERLRSMPQFNQRSPDLNIWHNLYKETPHLLIVPTGRLTYNVRICVDNSVAIHHVVNLQWPRKIDRIARPFKKLMDHLFDHVVANDSPLSSSK